MNSKDESRAVKSPGAEGRAAKKSDKKGLGRRAVEAGLITEKQLEAATYEHERGGGSLPDILRELYGLSPETIQHLLAEDAGIEALDLSRLTADSEALKKIPRQFASEHKVLPLSLAHNRLVVAMANPFDLATLDQLQFMTRLYIDACFAPESQILAAIERYYGAPSRAVPEPAPSEEAKAYAGAEEPAETAGTQVIRLVDSLVSRAIGEEATDIHLEPGEKSVKVRYRIDGILRACPPIAKALQPAVTTRIKIMANMDISENRLPQDGRISFPREGKNYDLRVSTFPTIHGEKVVLRILDKERVILGLEQLGFSPRALSIFKRSIQRPNGIILVTGPTGSGKTTTLYSALTYLNSAEKNIMTLEEPVEYEIPDILQSQINLKAGLTFASGLRSILRQDPDIIFVGEMRDSETVDVAIRAALTGHLVLSTLHTNDAVGAIPRLLDMEVNPALMASTLVAVVAQRLVRRICSHCKEKASPDPSLLQLAGLIPDKAAGGRLAGSVERGETSFHRGRGCARCFQSGYRGRIGIFEILALSPVISQMIAQRSSTQAIFEQARKEGMVTMMEDGVEKAREGITTLEEVIRVAYTP